MTKKTLTLFDLSATSAEAPALKKKGRGWEISDSRLDALDEQAREMRRGLGEEEAVALIVNGFAKHVLKELPMEFAVEAQKLPAISLEGSVG